MHRHTPIQLSLIFLSILGTASNFAHATDYDSMDAGAPPPPQPICARDAQDSTVCDGDPIAVYGTVGPFGRSQIVIGIASHINSRTGEFYIEYNGHPTSIHRNVNTADASSNLSFSKLTVAYRNDDALSDNDALFRRNKTSPVERGQLVQTFGRLQVPRICIPNDAAPFYGLRCEEGVYYSQPVYLVRLEANRELIAIQEDNIIRIVPHTDRQ